MIIWTKEEDDFIRTLHAEQKYTWKELYEMYCVRFGNRRQFYAFKSHFSNILKLRLKDPHSHSCFAKGVTSESVGTARKINGYWMTKVSDITGKSGSHDAYRQNWKFTHRLIWETINGPIPEGHSVMFLDGDHDNMDISNLVAIPVEIQGRVKAYKDPQLTLLAIEAAKLDLAIKEVRQELHED